VTRAKAAVLGILALPVVGLIVVVTVLPMITLVLMVGAQQQSAAADPCAGQDGLAQPAVGPVGGAARAAAGAPSSAGMGVPVVSASSVGGAQAPVEGLNAAQSRVASTIVAVGEQRQIPPNGIVVALAVARQESGYRNLANNGQGVLRPEQRGVEASLRFPNDGEAHDHGSVNAFQQQYPWWGSIEQLMQPAYAAGKFYEELVKVPGWQSLPLTVAAQRVQKSAYPTAYADDEVAARRIYAALKGAPMPADAQVLCGGVVGGAAMDCPPTGLPAEKGLTPDAVRVLRCAHKQFPEVKTFYGVGQRPAGTGDDHAMGRGVDIMIDDYTSPAGKARGDKIAAWLQANQKALGVKYLIWDVKIWHVQRNAEGWRGYRYPGAAAINDTTLHKDHVHVSVFGNAAVSASAAGGPGAPVAGSWTNPMQPGSYRMTSPFGMRVHPVTGVYKLHTGQDMAGPTGTPIMSASNGVVKSAATNTAYGNLTVVDAGGGIEVYYAHQDRMGVRTGQQVKAGQVIGTRGNTGYSTGAHLHFEIRQNGQPVDPLPFMKARGVDLAAGASR